MDQWCLIYFNNIYILSILINALSPKLSGGQLLSIKKKRNKLT